MKHLSTNSARIQLQRLEQQNHTTLLSYGLLKQPSKHKKLLYTKSDHWAMKVYIMIADVC